MVKKSVKTVNQTQDPSLINAKEVDQNFYDADDDDKSQ